MNLESGIRAEARRLGFDVMGIARADLPLEADFERYEAFVEQGMHGSMDWLAGSRTARRQLNEDTILHGAKSVICLARQYGRSAEHEEKDPELARRIARYARGQDYHNGVRKKLRTLAKYLRRLGTEDNPVHARPLCDEEPILERAWAARAGLGFVGKNGLLIVPGVGSFVLLGEVVTTLPLAPDSPIPERCGSCTRCLEACPTNAFVAPFVLDPRRCVSYLTIENRGEIEVSLREGVGTHLFGCDDCQTVCPFNARVRAPLRGRAPMPIDAKFEPLARWQDMTLRDLLELDEEGFEAMRRGTPVARATREGLQRNAAIVMGNRADPSDLEALTLAQGNHAAEMVRDAAAWALARVKSARKTSE